MDEKRKYPRFPAAAIVEIQLEDEVGAPVESLNMSLGGLLLSTNEKLPVGGRVKLQLDLDSAYSLNAGIERNGGPGEGRIIEATAQVVRIKGAAEIGYEIAIAFEEIEPGDAESINDLLK